MGCIVIANTHNRHSSRNVEQGVVMNSSAVTTFWQLELRGADAGNVEGGSVTVRSSVGNRDCRQLVEGLQQLQRKLSTDIVRLRIRRVPHCLPNYCNNTAISCHCMAKESSLKTHCHQCTFHPNPCGAAKVSAECNVCDVYVYRKCMPQCNLADPGR